MLEVELPVPDGANTDEVVRAVERACLTNRLDCTLRGTLARYPGSVHWHLKMGRQKGTLEVTWWETGRRLWFKVAENRTGEWMEEIVPRLKEQIKELLD